MVNGVLHRDIRKAKDGSLIVYARYGPALFEEGDRIPGKFGLPFEAWYKEGKLPVRDRIRRRCYRAEQQLRAWMQRTGGQRTFSSLYEVAAYYHSVVKTVWFRRRFPFFEKLIVRHRPNRARATAEVLAQTTWRDASGRSRTAATMSEIVLSSWAMGMESRRGSDGGEIVLLHELAHAIVPAGHMHGRVWAYVFISLVRQFVSREAAKQLIGSFVSHKVKYMPYRPRKSYKLIESAARAREARMSREMVHV